MPTNENTAQEKQDVYARVTSQIVNAIEQGVSNWRMPWHTSGKFAFSPVNVVSTKVLRRGFAQPVSVLPKSWVQNRVQLAPGTPNIPTKWSLAEHRINSIGAEWEITNQPLYQLS